MLPDNLTQFNTYPLKGVEVYKLATELIATDKRDDYMLFSAIVQHKDAVIYDIALTNQTFIAYKLGISQAQVSLLNKILKVL